MLEDRFNKRLLLENGVSVLSMDSFVREILKNGDPPVWAKTVESKDTALYSFFYDQDIHFSEDSYEECQPPKHTTSEEAIDALIELLETSERYDGSEDQQARIQKELDFFKRTGNIPFLIKVWHLIASFKEHNIVWGVGRGSACSSLVLYILEVHDVDPLKYFIKFSELSKDVEDD